MTWTLDGRNLESILVTRLRYLGDVVMATVVLEALRRGDPGLHLGFLCEAPYAAVLQGHPHLDRLHVLSPGRTGADARVRAVVPGQGASGRGTWGTIRQLRTQRYDLAVDLFFNPRSAFLLMAAGIPLRIGGTAGWRHRLYTHIALNQDGREANGPWAAAAPGGLGHHLGRLRPLRHLESGLGFASWLEREAGGVPLRPIVADPGLGPMGRAALSALGVQGARDFILLCPGATWRSKEWPAPRWRELAQELAGSQPHSLAVLAPPGRAQAWESLASAVPAGRGGVLAPLPLAEVLGLVGAAAAVVTVDGGIVHAAVGLGIPTLALFGPTDPDLWFPYARSGPFGVLAARPACHPCDRRECDMFVCLPDLQAGPVAAALDGLLRRAGSGEQPGPHSGINRDPSAVDPLTGVGIRNAQRRDAT